MKITGKIPITHNLSNKEILERLPDNESKIEGNRIVIKTNQIPFFAEHKLFLFTHNKLLNYKLEIPAMWPLVFFLYLSVLFLADFKHWNLMVVGSIIVTGILFALYVINDKGARSYIHRYLKEIIADEFSITEQNKINIYSQNKIKLDNPSQQKYTHTGQKDTVITYHLK